MNTIGIYGAGQMGKNLAVLFAGLNLKVFLYTRKSSGTDQEVRQLARITKRLNKELNLDNVNIQITEDVEALKNCQLIIEAVSENIETKLKCIQHINTICNNNTIVSSTTSTKSITELSMQLSFKENFIGLHFFNPPTLINFLEIIKGEHTSDNTIKIIQDFFNNLNRNFIFLNKENPGFIVNRALFLMLNEAIYELYEGLATPIEIDRAFKDGLNHPMGPLELCDFIGLDIVLDILTTLYDEYNDTKYRACYLLKQKVRAGKLGKKSKEGFYKY